MMNTELHRGSVWSYLPRILKQREKPNEMKEADVIKEHHNFEIADGNFET